MPHDKICISLFCLLDAYFTAYDMELHWICAQMEKAFNSNKIKRIGPKGRLIKYQIIDMLI